MGMYLFKILRTPYGGAAERIIIRSACDARTVPYCLVFYCIHWIILRSKCQREESAGAAARVHTTSNIVSSARGQSNKQACIQRSSDSDCRKGTAKGYDSMRNKPHNYC